MTSDLLRLQFVHDGDGTGELFAEVRCREFSGVGSAWFSDQTVIEFAVSLAAAYPLPKDAPLSLRGGIWNMAGTALEQVRVGLEFYPIGPLGRVGCHIVLNTGNRDVERPKSQSSVTVELETTYSRIEAFAKALEMLAKGITNEAVLEAEG